MVRTYQRAWLRKDIVAGIALTALLVPAGMGYAEAAGLPVIYGLYASSSRSSRTRCSARRGSSCSDPTRRCRP